MSTFTDLEKDAASVDGFVSENGLIPTRRNGPKPSYQYLVDRWNAEIAATILEMNKSRGFRVVGTFADGFTYELFNDVGIDADGNSWIYVGAGAPNKVVPAGTVPSVGAGYEQVTFNSDASVLTANGRSIRQEGIGVWDAGTTYPVDGLVKGSNGKLYLCVTGQSGNDPVSDDGTNWTLFKLEASSVSELINLPLIPGMVISTNGYYVSGDAGNAKYLIKTNSQAISDGDDLTLGGGNHQLNNGHWAVLFIGMVIDIRKFGAKTGIDSTIFIQGAINRSNSVGGIPVVGGAEAYYVSNITSGTTEHAIEMKSNVHLMLPKGAEITKPPAEREVNGSIIGIGVERAYGGATNFKISGFKLSDGDVNKGARTRGSLITLNSGTDFEISGMEFGNSDFHDVDIRGCKNVKIWGNKHTSLVVGGAAPYQFDVVTNATDSALFPNDNIQIYLNTRDKHTVLAGYYSRSFEFAHGCTSKNIKIFNNNFNETNNSSLLSVVGNATERDEKIEGLEVYCNTFRIDGTVTNWVNLTINGTNDFDASTNYMKGINIHHNKFYGKTSQGMQLSMAVGGATNFGQFDAQIHDNELEFNIDVLTSALFGGLNGQLLTDISVKNNKIKILTANTEYKAFKELPVINFGSCEQCSYVGNELFIIGNITNNFIQLRPIKYRADLLVDLGLVGTWDCVNNKVYGDTFTHAVLLDNYAGLEPTVLGGKVSGNFIYGTPSIGGTHYSLNGNVWLSDGTNNLQYIDWGASGVSGETEVLALSTSFKLLNHPLPFKSEGNMTPILKGLISTYGQDLGVFSMDITKQYISATQSAGCSIEFNQTTNDDFNVVTGTDGVHMNFNETTFQPLLYANAWLRVLAGV